MKKICLLALFLAPVLASSQSAILRDDPQSQFTCNADSLRALSEINIIGASDAYSWLSADGLRLYFTQDDGGYRIMLAKRPNLDSPFASPTEVPLPDELSSTFSCWLTADELNIYLSNGDSLFHLSRNNVNDDFESFTIVTIIGGEYSFIAGQSFDPGGSEMYAYTRVGVSRKISIFQKTAPDTYVFTDFLALPNGMEPSPGQLSKNGLHYYFGSSVEAPGIPGLFVLSRENLSQPFEAANMTKIEAVQNLTQAKGQCTVSADEKCLVFSYSVGNSWVSNDLYMIKCDGNFVSTQAPSVADWAVYPNPSTGAFLIKGTASEELYVDVYNALGLKVWSQQMAGEGADIQLSGQPNGIYLIHLREGNKSLGIKKLQLLD
ncbi:MAG: T9SS type A sorting domain-containing protein [Saprospiraceae bacterium]|nr:T9SS type A sorting domain-containing protein [Saprospiraceae bacterium]